MKNINNHFRLSVCIILSGPLLMPNLAIAASSLSYSRTMSHVPPSFSQAPRPNVFITLDDSRSMMGEVATELNSGTRKIIEKTGGTGGFDYEVPKNFTNPLMWIKFDMKWYLTSREAPKTARGEGSSGFFSANYYKKDNDAVRYLRSSDGNTLYYNPRIRYEPWGTIGTHTYKDANVKAVVVHPYDPKLDSGAKTINLEDTSLDFYPATYFEYNLHPNKFTQDKIPRIDEFTEVNIGLNQSYTRHEARDDCDATECTREQELQNFANWLQYYRSRSLISKGALLKSLKNQDGKINLGFTKLNSKEYTTTRVDAPGIIVGIDEFKDAHKTEVLSEIIGTRTEADTPLRLMAITVGEYFKSHLNTDRLECRRNHHILTTDGLWNDKDIQISDKFKGNHDNFDGKRTPHTADGSPGYVFRDSGPYETDDPLLEAKFTVKPFADEFDNTLSDFTSRYWITDLSPDVTNSLAPTDRDPAFWQHLSTHTIGIGIGASGKVTSRIDTKNGRRELIADKTDVSWPNPNYSNTYKGDDLIHAAMSSRGEYFRADDSTSLTSGFNTIFSETQDQRLQGAGLQTNSVKMTSDNILYQATMNPNGWQGRIYAFKENGNAFDNRPTSTYYTNANQIWEASNKMPIPSARKIYTMNPDPNPSMVNFQYGNLSNDQKLSLGNDLTIVDYLRGSDTNEVSKGGQFRDRIRYTVDGTEGGVLGDIVNSSPLKGPAYGGGYDRIVTIDRGGDSYNAFRNTLNPGLDDMKNTLFVGANDGMFHAFNLTNGVEKFAYVPAAVYTVTSISGTENRLELLSDPAYSHRYTVDGPPNIGDAYIVDGSSKKWKSILVSSNGAGARGVFAIDVTDTTDISSQNFKWELTEKNDADIGFVLGYPHIVQLTTGDWAAIFGNGADSKNGKAILYIVNLSTGAEIKKIEASTVTGNGLMQPNFVLNSNREVTAIYAGDLQGSMWKFDVSSTDKRRWAKKEIFQAKGKSNRLQPISVMPEITAHSDGGVMLVFGTGKLFEVSDTAASGNVNLDGQSIYGIWDKPGETTTISRTKLVEQKLLSEVSGSFKKSSTEAPEWATNYGWYMDLPASDGSRINLNPQQVRNIVFLVVNTPKIEAVPESCTAGGSSLIIALDPLTGANPSTSEKPVFDVNGDGSFTKLDGAFNVKTNTKGILTQPIFTIPSTTPSYSGTPNYNQPYPIFDRGQASGGRLGGVELDRSPALPSVGGGGGNPCDLDFRAGVADASLEHIGVRVCSQDNKPHISWRQLR